MDDGTLACDVMRDKIKAVIPLADLGSNKMQRYLTIKKIPINEELGLMFQGGLRTPKAAEKWR